MKKLFGALASAALLAAPVVASAQSGTSTGGRTYGVAGVAGVAAAYAAILVLVLTLSDDDEAPRSP